ncbi:MAG: GatB/YqeY domain-containing protein, partial [Methyloceanibacter sp.]
MRETINAALKAATKARDMRRVSTLRLVSAAIKDRDIAARGAG